MSSFNGHKPIMGTGFGIAGACYCAAGRLSL